MSEITKGKRVISLALDVAVDEKWTSEQVVDKITGLVDEQIEVLGGGEITDEWPVDRRPSIRSAPGYTKLRITFEETSDDSQGISEYLTELVTTVKADYYPPMGWYREYGECEVTFNQNWHLPDTLADDGASYELVLMVPDDVLETVEKWLHQNPNFTQEGPGDVKTVRYERVDGVCSLTFDKDWTHSYAAEYEIARDAVNSGLQVEVVMLPNADITIRVLGKREKILEWLGPENRLDLDSDEAPWTLEDWEERIDPVQ